MDLFETVVAASISSGLVAGALVWIAKTWLSERLKQSIQHEYAALLEVHKTSLKNESDVKLAELQSRLTAANAQSVERLKADLQVAAATRQLRRKHLYDREAEAIAETYENLSDLRTKVASYVSVMETASMGTRAERRDAVNAAQVKFYGRFRLHRLYLPRALAESVNSFVRALSHKALDFNLRVDISESRDRDSLNAWIEVDKFMDEEAPRLFDQLESEFRRRLGQEEDLDIRESSAPPPPRLTRRCTRRRPRSLTLLRPARVNANPLGRWTANVAPGEHRRGG